MKYQYFIESDTPVLNNCYYIEIFDINFINIEWYNYDRDDVVRFRSATNRHFILVKCIKGEQRRTSYFGIPKSFPKKEFEMFIKLKYA